ncbi:UNVERIFIED_CONTAM: hypothetical protein Sradi_0441500 [Sesamum radiatum]|uniref:Uncharacterized protein n=1 Tax=Sesamum radiatum TaxID=300843 RepID=A0AAW2WB78_SESRA
MCFLPKRIGSTVGLECSRGPARELELAAPDISPRVGDAPARARTRGSLRSASTCPSHQTQA